MKTKQITFIAPGEAVLTENELPELNKGKLLVRMLYTVISGGTERDNLLGKPNSNVFQNSKPFPKSLGYCGIGIIENKAEDSEGFSINDMVLVYHGIHAKYNCVSANQLTKVEDADIKPVEAAFTVIMAMSLGGVRKLEVEIGESAMVFGQGILGLFATQFLRLNGAYPVIAADLNPMRRELALKIGADYVLDPSETGFLEKVKELTGGKGINATVEVTGNSFAMKQALECASRLGRISLLGCTRVSDCSIDYYNLVHRPGVKLIGAHNFIRPVHESYPHHWTHHDDCRTILKLIKTGRVNVSQIISEIFNPEDASNIYNRLVNDKDFPAGVVFDWNMV
jgi:threonine dehydrogenase-like Zn-dependent dehydrogenase